MTDLKFKNYIGSMEMDVEDNILHGRLLFIKDLVTYEAETPADLETAFRNAVEDYLLDCAEQGVEPDTPFKGQFNVRVDPKLHRALAVSARVQGKKLNEYVAEVLKCHEDLGEHGQLKRVPGHQVMVIAPSAVDTFLNPKTKLADVKSHSSSAVSGWVVETEKHNVQH